MVIWLWLLEVGSQLTSKYSYDIKVSNDQNVDMLFNYNNNQSEINHQLNSEPLLKFGMRISLEEMLFIQVYPMAIMLDTNFFLLIPISVKLRPLS